MKRGIKNCCLIIAVFVACVCVSCRQQAGPVSYVKKISGSPYFNKTTEAGGMQYTFQLRTPEFLAIKDAVVNGQGIDGDVYAQRLQDLKGHTILLIRQKVVDNTVSPLKYLAGSVQEYQGRLQYYEYAASNDITMICNGDTLKPVSYTYENNLDIAPYNTMVIIFPGYGNAKEIKFEFNDKIMNHYYLHSAFETANYSRLPKIKI